MSNTDIPNKLELTCTVSGKKVTWTNKAIIAKKIEQFGTLEAFVAQFKCKGAFKRSPAPGKTWNGQPIVDESSVAKDPAVLKPVFEQGVAMGKLSKEEYKSKYVTRVYHNPKTGTCTVTAPRTSGDTAAGR